MALRRVLKAIERALTGQRLAVRSQHRFQFARQHRERRVLAQLIVIDKVLVAQREAKNPLPHQRLHLMLDKARIAPVGEARRKPPHQAEPAIDLPQYQRPRIRGDVAAIKAGNHRAARNRFKFKPLRRTLCRHRGIPEPQRNYCSTISFSDSRLRCTGMFEKSRLARPDLAWNDHFCFARAAAAYKIQHLGNEAGLPTLADIEALQHDLEDVRHHHL
jgi:hypothetical protein